LCLSGDVFEGKGKRGKAMKKKVRVKNRLPWEMVMILRHCGGAHSPKKGKKGYNRREFQKSLRERRNENG